MRSQLCVQLALEGHILGEACETIKVDRDHPEAQRATLHALVDATPMQPVRCGRTKKVARP